MTHSNTPWTKWYKSHRYLFSLVFYLFNRRQLNVEVEASWIEIGTVAHFENVALVRQRAVAECSAAGVIQASLDVWRVELQDVPQ